MQLLIVNPNTSKGVTQNIDTAAQAVAGEGDLFKTVSAAFGPELIVTSEDAVAAVDGVLATIAANIQGVDGIILASFGDTGLEAVRAHYPQIPVVGIATAAYAAASCFGGKFSIVTFDESLSPGLHASIEKQGMSDRLHRIEAVSNPAAFDAATVQTDRFEAIQAICLQCTQEPITSIVMGGGPLAGLSSRINMPSGLPVIDGTQAAVGILRSAANQESP